MIVEDVKAPLHKVPEYRLLGQPRADDLGQMIMGRLQSGQSAMLPYHNMTVAGTGIELKFRAIELPANFLHEHIRIGGGDLTGTVIHNGLFLVGLRLRQGHQIAAEDHIVRGHLHAHAQRFQGRSSGKLRQRIVAHDRQVRHLAARGHSCGHVLHHAQLSFGRQVVHGGDTGILQRGFAAQLRHRFVRHPVAQNYNVFHPLTPFLEDLCPHCIDI